MSIAGAVIVVNSRNAKLSRDVCLILRDLEKAKAYYHVGQTVLTSHLLPDGCKGTTKMYMSALYAAISGTVRCGVDVIADLSITTKEDYEIFQKFMGDLDVVWVNLDDGLGFITDEIKIHACLGVESMAHEIFEYIRGRFNAVAAHPRFVSEVSPVPKASKPGKIILLTGSPSSGKSTLSKTIQSISDDIFLHVGIDTVMLHYLHLRYQSGVPSNDFDDSWKKPNFNPTEYHKEGVSWIAPGPNSKNPYPDLRLQFGRVARLAFSAMYASIAEISRQGFNVISDNCFHFPDMLQEAKSRLKDLPVIYVALSPEIEVMERREIDRGDRMHGMAISVYKQMVKDFGADIVIDTGKYTPEEEAELILKYVV